MDVPILDRNGQVFGTFRSLMHILFSASRTEQNLVVFQRMCEKVFRPLSEAAAQALYAFDASVETHRYGIAGPITLGTRFEGEISISTRNGEFVEIRFRALVHGMIWFSPRKGAERLLDAVSDVICQVYGKPLPPFTATGDGEATSTTDGVVECYVSRWLAPRLPAMVVVCLGNSDLWSLLLERP